jgi:hypothetical protein
MFPSGHGMFTDLDGVFKLLGHDAVKDGYSLAFTSPCAHTVHGPIRTAWVELAAVISMYRNIKHLVVVFKRELGAVPCVCEIVEERALNLELELTMMYIPARFGIQDLDFRDRCQHNVPVENQDPANGRLVHYDACSDRDVVVEAEAHVFVGFGVMPRRTDDSETVAYLLVVNDIRWS